ncbi:MAG: hypothetical protein JNL30_17660 [Rubrivivax sp.]|nr:hypothetical protein [Rubrivivax sp.]
MSFPSTHAAIRLSHRLSAIALGLAAAACGGGGSEDAGVALSAPSAHAAPGASAASMAALAPAANSAVAAVSVAFEGCVLDRHYIPTTGTPVRALAADGRLLGNAISDDLGRFTLRLPAGGEVTLQVDRPQGESLAQRVGAAASKAQACLLD